MLTFFAVLGLVIYSLFITAATWAMCILFALLATQFSELTTQETLPVANKAAWVLLVINVLVMGKYVSMVLA